MRRLINIFKFGALAAAFAVLAFAPLASADSLYGKDSYGDCKYSRACPSTTVVGTPSGLEVAINITDGQELPAGGYTVTITPINGQGETFDYAELYLDGVLVATVEPDETGTAEWFWDTDNLAGTEFEIKVYDEGSLAVTKKFSITIAPPDEEDDQGSGSGTGRPKNDGKNDNIPTILKPIALAMNLLPAKVVVLVPYFLLLLLLLAIVILIMQGLREAKEVRLLREYAERARLLADEKSTFTDLASHYLRTPTTLLGGGAEFLASSDPPVDPDVLNKMTAAVKSLGAEVENVLAQTINDPRLKLIQSAAEIQPVKPVWGRVVFWLPIALAAFLMFVFNLTASYAGRYDLVSINTLTQAGLWVVLAVALYSAVRRLQLYRRDLAKARQESEQQAAIDESRGSLIASAVTSLKARLDDISRLMPSIPDGPSRKFVATGFGQINQVMQKFVTVAGVVPPAPSAPFQTVSVGELVERIKQSMRDSIIDKNLHIELHGAGEISSQNPEWVEYSLIMLLDNAVAFSPRDAVIKISADSRGKFAVISVEDGGPGVAPENIPKLFQPFSKADGALKFDHPGIGLSLYICRLYMSALGGNTAFGNSYNGGAKVSLKFRAR